MIFAFGDNFIVLHIGQTHHSKSAWWICSPISSRGINLSKCGRIGAFRFRYGHIWIRWGTSRILRGIPGSPSAACRSGVSCQTPFYIHFACVWIAGAFSLRTRYLPMWPFYLLYVYIRNFCRFLGAFPIVAYRQNSRNCNTRHWHSGQFRLKSLLCLQNLPESRKF